ncbi:GntR family transcriptional regulator [Bacillaceae bacterium JMAK1]|nr:GntR family transcriptional regulator [Bacillaceae bacterium JMAK1]
MITFQIDRTRSKTYLYQQLYEQLKQAILQKDLKAHDKLPSKRELAGNVSVSFNSVNAAYQQLVAEGYVYAKERMGYFVEEITMFEVEPNEALQELPSHLREDEKTKEHIASFSHMSADHASFPLDSWLKCEQQALKAERKQLENYVHPQGLYTVRQTLARFLRLTRGVKCRPEQIVLGSGTQQLLRQLSSIMNPDTTYGIEEPGYQRLRHLLESEERSVAYIPLDDQGISVSHLEKSHVSTVITTPSHQFPTGIIMPISRRIELLNWAATNEDRYIIEDDYDSEFIYDADAVPSLQSLDGSNRVIYTGTFSKSLLPGLRISYMVLPIPLLEKYRDKLAFLMSSCSTLAQLTLQRFIETGEYQKHIKKMTKLYRMRRERLIEELERAFERTIKITGANSGLHFVATFKSERGEQEILERAKALGLEVYGTSRFYQQAFMSTQTSLVIGFARLNEELMERAVTTLKEAVFGS